jgi:hypothetical protein
MSDECIERCGQHAKSSNVHAIEIEEAEECPNFLQGRGLLPVLYALNFDRVHGNGVFSDDNSKILHFCYDPGSSLRKRNDFQGKGWLDFNSLDLTNGLARADTENNVSGTRTGGSKG